MTKTIVLGEQQNKAITKPIEFKYYLDARLDVNPPSNNPSYRPSRFKYIELICKNYKGSYHLMFAYNDPSRDDGTLFVGFWNNGTVK